MTQFIFLFLWAISLRADDCSEISKKLAQFAQGSSASSIGPRPGASNEVIVNPESRASQSNQKLQEKLEASRHEDWKKTWKAEKGENTPRYKTTDKPGNPLGEGGANPPKELTEAQIKEYERQGFLVDITKVTDPTELPQKIRQATQNSAEIAFETVDLAKAQGLEMAAVLKDWGAVESGKLSYSDFLKKYPIIFEGSDKIHEKWVQNNSWLPEKDPQRADFSELPPSEQKKDTDFIIDAMKLSVSSERMAGFITDRAADLARRPNDLDREIQRLTDQKPGNPELTPQESKAIMEARQELARLTEATQRDPFNETLRSQLEAANKRAREIYVRLARKKEGLED